MQVHKGHRQRMKRRFLEHGLDNFDDVNVLELLLFYADPRRDTNPLAHALLDQFGSLAGVLEAAPGDLEKIPGIGENAATLLRLIPEVSRRYMVTKTPETEPVETAAQAGRYFLPRFMYQREEMIQALYLDARRRPICCRELGQGVVNAVEIRTRRLVEQALETRCSAVILAHNHPSGLATPSQEDLFLTRYIQDSLKPLGITLYDHVILTDDDMVSLRDSRYLTPL